MDLTLTTEDQRRLTNSLRTLVSPLEHGTLDEWRHRCCESLRDLLDGDIAIFQLAETGEHAMYSSEIAEETLVTYPRWMKEVSGALSARLEDLVRRQTALGVWSRREFWGPDLKAYYKTAYYNEFVVPVRGFDSVGMAVAAGRPGVLASLFLAHDRPNGRKFGARGVRLLELLRPAFQAGVHAYATVHGERKRLLETIDQLREPLLLFDARGRTLHRNAAARRLLEEEPERVSLLAKVQQVAGSLLEGTRSAVLGRELLEYHPPAFTFSGGLNRYDVSLSLLDTHGFEDEDLILVSVVRASEEAPSLEALQRGFGLTIQEARVARLLWGRRTNREVAEALSISPHTARHHTERVLSKMGVASRNDVRGALDA